MTQEDKNNLKIPTRNTMTFGDKSISLFPMSLTHIMGHYYTNLKTCSGI